MFRLTAYGFAALLGLAGLAFWPKYLSRLGEGIDPYTHGHAALALCWCVLLVVQPLLASSRREAHRRLGAVSFVLAPALAVVSLLLAHSRFRAMDPETFGREAATLYLPVSTVALFLLSYLLALRHRRTVALHARFMVLTGLPMIDPVLGRVLFFYGPALPHPLLYQAVTYAVTDVVIVCLLLRTPLPRPLTAAFAIPAALFPVAHLGWFTVAQGPAWTRFASWFRALPLP